MRTALFAMVWLWLAAPALADDRAINHLVAEYEAYSLKDDPFAAGQQGDLAALARLPDVTPAADQARIAALSTFKHNLAAIPVTGLSDAARLNHDFLAWTLDRRLAGLTFDEARMPFNSDGGFHQTLNYVATTTPIRTMAEAKAWISRLRALPKFYADNIANARRGIATGFTQPESTNRQVLDRARAQAAAVVETDPLMIPLTHLPASIADAEDLRHEALSVITDQVRPAQRAFVTFLEREYLPVGRPTLGIRSLPGGEAYYTWLVADHTTTDLTPDQIHQIGLAEVARIRKEMDGVIAETGFKGDFRAFQAYLRGDPQFYATSREDLLEKASRIAKRIDNELPSWFATLPRLTYGVRPVPADIEETYTTGRYFGGSPEQGVSGGYMVNTSKLDQRPLYELPALTLHEAVPGHHLQIALGQELQSVPNFRRNADITAFTEGWGLYSEKLGGEMGIYRNAYERFGRLSYEMWRACRLVADTGLHWKGWSLDQARACFADNTALSPLNIEVELARYVSWPGQALAYKIGEMKIVALRQTAKAALGDKFDIRRFHDAVLLAGPLPLSLLEQRVNRWIDGEKAR
ncbi:MAG: DUF885 domain-containing protein [Phenylobacterium zucineum]|nr:MAG: DUF885 domain-containing protein [Phenylobacterium zucineum]